MLLSIGYYQDDNTLIQLHLVDTICKDVRKVSYFFLPVVVYLYYITEKVHAGVETEDS